MKNKKRTYRNHGLLGFWVDIHPLMWGPYMIKEVVHVSKALFNMRRGLVTWLMFSIFSSSFVFLCLLVKRFVML